MWSWKLRGSGSYAPVVTDQFRVRNSTFFKLYLTVWLKLKVIHNSLNRREILFDVRSQSLRFTDFILDVNYQISIWHFQLFLLSSMLTTLLHHDTAALILSHWELSINQLSNQMSTGPCDVKLSQDQRRFIKKKSRQEEERINPEALRKECEQKLTAFFYHG